MTKKKIILLLLLCIGLPAGLCMICSGFSWMFHKVTPSQSKNVSKKEKTLPDRSRLESDARYRAKDFIRENLKAPSTAKFVDCEIAESKDTCFIVYAEVDAQNSFGANIRNYFLVYIEANGEITRSHPLVGIWGSDSRPSQQDLISFKRANLWPDSSLYITPKRHRK